ncbi:DnaJ domain-containing protein [Chlamydoabsidia padenii]|nr:DnaJ domain-containing protein [Chlamydoabsidia padenii]
MWTKTCYRFFSTHSRKSPYDILQLPRHATQADIKKRYYELAKTLHPDRVATGDEELKQRTAQAFQQVSDAYDFLKQPERRTAYLNTGYGWDFSHHSSSSPPPPPRYHYKDYDNVTYRGGVWSSHHKTRYASNATIFALLSGIMITLAVTNLLYAPFGSRWLQALDRHHAKTSRDLELARKNAQQYGNQRGVQRVMQQAALKDKTHTKNID